ncbi:helix-turn-helix transcriptional regulator [Mycobacterium avium subsp. hominissuis]|uniref:helix-turn-helix domain-containing protein n=1 Tax=Mycobacterium avium TaxID=1764 RepID=UPI001CC37820|nr:helix-turn-helix transcriptional regulator [Mycobacterium avium]MBZ4509112.1 helix-turn-helix transcriptional regulator [Mycobacterium avium subsp. hominissuis]
MAQVLEAAQAEAIFAENLRVLRDAAEMSQSQFAAEMSARGFNWQQVTVYKVEKRHRQIQLGEAQAAAQILGVPLQQMIRTDANTAVQVQRLRRRAWKLGDARIKLVDAVDDYQLACEQLISAIDDAEGLLTAEEAEQLRRQGLLDAIRDFPEIKRMTNPPDEDAADE